MSVAAKRWDLRKNKVWSSQEFTAKRESGRKSTDGITAQNLSPIHQRACLVPIRTELSHFSVLMQCLERQPLHPISLNSSMSLGAHLVLLFPSLSQSSLSFTLLVYLFKILFLYCPPTPFLFN